MPIMALIKTLVIASAYGWSNARCPTIVADQQQNPLRSTEVLVGFDYNLADEGRGLQQRHEGDVNQFAERQPNHQELDRQ
jgi:hypothetical protein